MNVLYTFRYTFRQGPVTCLVMLVIFKAQTQLQVLFTISGSVKFVLNNNQKIAISLIETSKSCCQLGTNFVLLFLPLFSILNTFLCTVIFQSIEKALTRRAKRYEKFQQALTLRARKYFDMMLAHRGYSGRMKIDHEEETLQIAVLVFFLQNFSSLTFSCLNYKLS